MAHTIKTIPNPAVMAKNIRYEVEWVQRGTGGLTWKHMDDGLNSDFETYEAAEGFVDYVLKSYPSSVHQIRIKEIETKILLTKAPVFDMDF